MKLLTGVTSLLMMSLCWPATTRSDISPWPNAVMPYIFDESLNDEDQKRIQKAIDEINSLKIVQLIDGTLPNFENSEKTLFIWHEYKCSSGYGWRKGPNNLLRVSSDCSHGTILHEILHALGIDHEQMNPEATFSFFPVRARSDWHDQFINEKAVSLTEHDPESIMHYHSWDTSICFQPDLEIWDSSDKDLPHSSCRNEDWQKLRPENNNGVDCHTECAVFYDKEKKLFGGQRKALSELDIEGLKRLYQSK